MTKLHGVNWSIWQTPPSEKSLVVVPVSTTQRSKLL